MPDGIVAIIVGVLSFLGTACGGYFSVRASNKLVQYRLDDFKEQFGEIKKKLDAHNHFGERLVCVEERLKIMKEDG
jgi:uncharacterized membrane-anchored protein YhcB (DUF1043 family)